MTAGGCGSRYHQSDVFRANLFFLVSFDTVKMKLTSFAEPAAAHGGCRQGEGCETSR